MPDDAAPKPAQDSPQGQPEQGQQPQGTVLRLHERDTKTSYANVCLLSSTREEMILNFGLTLPSASPDRREANMLVSDRIIMSVPAAKRLAIALSQAIQRYESAFGVIQLQPPAPPRGPEPSAEVLPPPRT